MKPFKIADSSSYCGAINCRNSKLKQPHLSFHRFPRDACLSKKWVQNTRRADLIGVSPAYLYENVKLCSAHFETSQYYSGGSKRLRRDATPTKFDISNPPKPVTVQRPLVKRQEPPVKPPKQVKTHLPVMDWGGQDLIFMDTDLNLVPEGSLDTATMTNAAAATTPTTSVATTPTTAVTTTPTTSGHSLTLSPRDENSAVTPGVSTVTKLTNRLKCKVYRQKKKIEKLQAEMQKKQDIHMEDVLTFTKQVLPPAVFNFMKLQLRCAGVKPKGRRYSDHELMMALALHYQGARAYRYMRTMFYLPHPRQLRKRMEHIQMLPGFQDIVINLLEEKHKKMAPEDRLVVLSLDEMQVRKKLVYHRGEDYIEGFEDLGEMGRTARVADQALVLMVRGIRQSWKQPIGFFYSAGPTAANVLQQLVEDAVRKLRKAGMQVVATVCDMGKPNQELMSRLGVSVNQPTFSVDGKEVVALYDAPHLFKCIRNALYKYDINHDHKKASWQHIRWFFAEDSKCTVKTAPSLRKCHVQLEAFKKMKVKFATKVMSRSVSTGIHLFCDFGRIPEECRGTAELLLRLNDVMDVLNSCRPTDACRNKRAFSAATEKQHTRILEEGRDWLSRWCVGDNAKIDSVAGLQLTINAIMIIWGTLRGMLGFMCTRRFNQDCVENFFGSIRQMNGQNDLPNATQFRNAYRKVSMNNMLKPMAGGNCEPDTDSLLAIATSSAARPDRPVPITSVECRQGAEAVVPINVDGVTDNVLAYVAGYLVHQEELRHDCAACARALLSGERQVRRSRETMLGLKSFTGLSATDMGKLKTPSEAFHRVIVAAYGVTETQARSAMLSRGVGQKLMLCIVSTAAYKVLHSTMCTNNRLECMVARFVRMQLHLTCAKVTAESGKGVNRLNRKFMKLSSRVSV